MIRPETVRHKGSPFTLEKAVPVDLFPGTKHCELVLLFVRGNQRSSSITTAADPKDHKHQLSTDEGEIHRSSEDQVDGQKSSDIKNEKILDDVESQACPENIAKIEGNPQRLSGDVTAADEKDQMPSCDIGANRSETA